MPTVLERIKEHIDAAKNDLKKPGPVGVDWYARCLRTAEELVPWLEGAAGSLIKYMEGVLNAPQKIRQMWNEIRPHVDLPDNQVKAFDDLLSLDEVLSKSLNGQVISSILTKRLRDTAPAQLALTMNIGNDFPDLYLRCGGTWDYSGLPQRKETGKEGGAKEFGASLVGESKRPVRVPDGLEVKTSPKTVKADCHYNHAGLHFAMVYRLIDGVYRVADLKVAFLRPSDYTQRGRNTEATTVKYSFGAEKFISVLSKPIELPLPKSTPKPATKKTSPSKAKRDPKTKSAGKATKAPKRKKS